MADLIQGKDYIAFFRRLKDRTKQDAGKVRFQTELTLNAEKEVETTKTKDGVVNSVSDGETSGECTSLAYREDKDTVNMWKEMRKWFRTQTKSKSGLWTSEARGPKVAKKSTTWNTIKVTLRTLKFQRQLMTK